MLLLDVVYRNLLIRNPDYQKLPVINKGRESIKKCNDVIWDILNSFYFDGITPFMLKRIYPFASDKVFWRIIKYYFEPNWLSIRLKELKHKHYSDCCKKKILIHGNPWSFQGSPEKVQKSKELHKRIQKLAYDARYKKYGKPGKEWRYNGDPEHDKRIFLVHSNRNKMFIKEGRHVWKYSGDIEHDKLVKQRQICNGRKGFIKARLSMLKNGHDGLLHSKGENYIINKIRSFGYDVKTDKIIENTASNNSRHYVPDGYIEKYNLIIECDGFLLKKIGDNYKPYWEQKYKDYSTMGYNLIIFKSDTIKDAIQEVKDKNEVIKRIESTFTPQYLN